ncbi:MAG: hypothetical protein Q9M22_04245 [Mariprofundaceae bacterium]|nr:hypothetical protein [Mariprofundaceae bacterium]
MIYLAHKERESNNLHDCGLAKIKNNLHLFLFFFFLLVLASCGFAEKSAITSVLEKRDQAVSERNIIAFAQLLADDFMENGINKEARISQEAALFKQFEQIKMHSHARTITLHGPHAECEQSYSLRVLRDGDWRSMVQRERIQLKKNAHGWKIIGGI